MKAPRLALALAFLLLAAAFAPAQKAPAAGSFKAEGSFYSATGSGKGSTAAEAESKARASALQALFSGLGKDGLYAEVFMGSPPLGLSFDPSVTAKDGAGYTSTASLRIDDESIRIVERGPYLAAAISLLDKADQSSVEAQSAYDRAGVAEAGGNLGEALNAYGMAQDSAQTALALIEPVGDTSIFSSERKRTASDLKRELQNQRDGAAAGIERIRKAEAALQADASGKAAQAVIDQAIAAADAAQALLDENAAVLQNPSTQGTERLLALRDRLSMESRTLSDTKAALARAVEALPAEKSYIADKADFAKRRLATAASSVSAAHRTIDREIRDPAERRAARSRAIRWAFLHEPREYVSFRAYLPFDLEAGNPNGIEATPLELRGALEGAFALGQGGLWVRSVASLRTTDLSPSSGTADEFAVSQSFDLGFYGRTLVFGGVSWDWLRTVGAGGTAIPKPATVKFGLGGVSLHAADGADFRRADWLLEASYQLPYQADQFLFWNAFNLALDADFRLGSIGLLEASFSHRLHRKAVTGAATDFAAVMNWAIGLGIRLPSPFAWGVEYGGDLIWPFDAAGARGELEPFRGGRFRFFFQYSI